MSARLLPHAGRAWLVAAWVLAAWALGCGADAHIRLLEPDDDASEMDASRPASRAPDAATGTPTKTPDLEVPDTPVPSTEVPDPELPDAAGPPLIDADGGSEPSSPAASALVLHYDFSGSGDVVPDLIGDRDAHLLGGALLDPSRSFINLDGVDDYVDLPNGVASGLQSATFVAWLTWAGGACWQRIFDFGISDHGENQVGGAVTALFMTPKACGAGTFTAMAEIEGAQHAVSDDEALPTGYAMQVALVVDDDTRTMTLYRDTEKVGEAAAPFRLDQLTDDNNWLGRSQWAQDGFFKGALGEFRIYSRALSAEELAQIRAEGFETP